MAEPRVVVRNASDPEQVKRAGRKERDAGELLRAAVVAVLETPAGRLLLWELLTRAGIYESIFAADPCITAHRAGRQDFGHALIALLLAADDEGYLLMEREARGRERSDNADTDAAHTPRAEDSSM